MRVFKILIYTLAIIAGPFCGVVNCWGSAYLLHENSRTTLWLEHESRNDLRISELLVPTNDLLKSHHLHLHWNLKFWVGKFAWGAKVKHAGRCQRTFKNKRFVDNFQQCFAFYKLSRPYFELSLKVKVMVFCIGCRLSS